eukprot:1157711-Pelagomonas_calceolata.AAC.23
MGASMQQGTSMCTIGFSNSSPEKHPQSDLEDRWKPECLCLEAGLHLTPMQARSNDQKIWLFACTFGCTMADTHEPFILYRCLASEKKNTRTCGNCLCTQALGSGQQLPKLDIAVACKVGVGRPPLSVCVYEVRKHLRTHIIAAMTLHLRSVLKHATICRVQSTRLFLACTAARRVCVMQHDSCPL